jgi:hypothetical protein
MMLHEVFVSFYTGTQIVYVPEGSTPIKVLIKCGSPVIVFKVQGASVGTKAISIHVATAGSVVPYNCYYLDSVVAPGDVAYHFFEMEN